MARAVHDGQIADNVKWLTFMSGSVEVENPTSDDDLDKALDGVRERVNELQDAGYMPKTKPLLYYLDFITMDLNRIKEQVEIEQHSEPPPLVKMQYECIGKMKMTIDWLKAQDKAGDWGTMILGDKGHEVVMPTLGSKAEVEEAIRTRHLPRHGETKEELIQGRVKRYRDDSKRITDGIDGQNTTDKERESDDETE